MKNSRLRKYREINDLTLKQMADRIGISFVHLSLLERGKRKPSINLAYLIAKDTGNFVSVYDWE